ncbi:MAG: hypothetical protein IPK07_08275 [Deltaproteobacteria bacterium]|nr:hypothetical protein [Deltaproteobacteria bacterium]
MATTVTALAPRGTGTSARNGTSTSPSSMSWACPLTAMAPTYWSDRARPEIHTLGSRVAKVAAPSRRIAGPGRGPSPRRRSELRRTSFR